MRRIAFMSVAALCAARCFGIAASQAWVESYVSNYVARSAAEVSVKTKTETVGGVSTITTGDGAVLKMEQASDAALKVLSSTPSATEVGVTNGTLFVWNGRGAYVCPAGSVECTATNMAYRGVGSTFSGGRLRFAGWFEAQAVRIQPSVSLSVTNGMQEASR